MFTTHHRDILVTHTLAKQCSGKWRLVANLCYSNRANWTLSTLHSFVVFIKCRIM